MKILKKREIDIAYVQETRWVGTKAHMGLSYGTQEARGIENVVGILVDRNLREWWRLRAVF